MDQETLNFFESRFAKMNEQMVTKEQMAKMNEQMAKMNEQIEDLNFSFGNIKNAVAAASHERDEIESFQGTYLVSDPTGFNSKRVIAGKRF